jgi:hypothetical protein
MRVMVGVIDEFSPFLWRGKGCVGFACDHFAMAKANGVADSHMQFLPAAEVNIRETSAYAAVPTPLSYKRKGEAAGEDGVFPIGVTKTALGRKIAAWAWATCQGRAIPAN